MKRTAFLINASRGPVVDQEALVDALRNNIIAGAGDSFFFIVFYIFSFSRFFEFVKSTIVTPFFRTRCHNSRTSSTVCLLFYSLREM
jgi:lactate dehydrogenase-like 2-hydroxyacid dehydrogenase